MSNTRKSLPPPRHATVVTEMTFAEVPLVGHTLDYGDQSVPIFVDQDHPRMESADLRCRSCGTAETYLLRKPGTDLIEVIVLEHASDCRWITANLKATGLESWRLTDLHD